MQPAWQYHPQVGCKGLCLHRLRPAPPACDFLDHGDGEHDFLVSPKARQRFGGVRARGEAGLHGRGAVPNSSERYPTTPENRGQCRISSTPPKCEKYACQSTDEETRRRERANSTLTPILRIGVLEGKIDCRTRIVVAKARQIMIDLIGVRRNHFASTLDYGDTIRKYRVLHAPRQDDIVIVAQYTRGANLKVKACFSN